MPKSPGARVLALVLAALVTMTIAALVLAMALRLGDGRPPAVARSGSVAHGASTTSVAVAPNSPPADPRPAATVSRDHQPARPSGPAHASPLALS